MEKVAIFHNYMDNIGGAEKVTLTLARELNADIYTTVLNYNSIKKLGFSDLNIKTIGWIPINAPFRQQLALMRFRMLNISKKYDCFIIAGDWAISSAVNNKPNIWYVHSPIREIWDLYEYVKSNQKNFLSKILFSIWANFNRVLINRNYVKEVDRLVCNSILTKNRVDKYLGRNARVIYPPVDTDLYKFNSVGDYWLSVNRLVSHKRIEIQMDAFAKLPTEKLIVVGSYEEARHFTKYVKYINSIKPDNVTLLKSVSSEDLIDLYANCKGVIITSLDEDFGLVAVEAMASGKPVIAPKEGGYLETVIGGKTGEFFYPVTSDNLICAIKKVSEKGPLFYKNYSQNRAKKFDTSIFINEIKKEINKL